MALAQYSKLVWYPSGGLARSIPARVFPEDSNTLAPLFTDGTGTTPAPNPINTTSDGHLTFWAEAGQYWIHMDSESIEVTVGGAPVSLTPSGTVVPETAFGETPAAGAANTYSRGDHTHGTPAAPVIPTPPSPAITVVGETSYGQTSAVGASTLYARGDHTHGTPAAPAVPGPGSTVVPEITFGLPSAAGAAGTWSRSDHTHGTPAAPSGGGFAERTARVRITDDNLSGLPAAAAWAVVVTSGGTALQCSIAASVGHRIRVVGRAMHKGAHFLDWVILDAAGVIDEYASTWSAAPGSEGDPALYPSLSFGYETGPPMFIVGAEHINAGLVTIGLAHQGAAAGNANLVYAHPTYPFQLRLENIGPEPT